MKWVERTTGITNPRKKRILYIVVTTVALVITGASLLGVRMNTKEPSNSTESDVEPVEDEDVFPSSSVAPSSSKGIRTSSPSSKSPADKPFGIPSPSPSKLANPPVPQWYTRPSQPSPAMPSPLLPPLPLDAPTRPPSWDQQMASTPVPTRTSPALSPMLPTAVGGAPVLLGDGILYRPGDLTVHESGLLLSTGLAARIIARTNYTVDYYQNGEISSSSPLPFHQRPDFGATFPRDDGGWIYVSNSEMPKTGEGGVGAITFDPDGNIVDYRWVLNGTTMNCGGGRTPWNTWVSCEEILMNGTGGGDIYQVDPTGTREPQITSVGLGGGRFESFTYDIRNLDTPHFFASEDRRRGALRRFTPHETNWDEDPWSMLHGPGDLVFLMLHPTDETGGYFSWTHDQQAAKLNAAENYPECEGIEVNDGTLYMVAKRLKILFTIDLDSGFYESHSTVHGAFDGSPDQVATILDHSTGQKSDSSMLYFTEEGGKRPGIHARNKLGQYFTVLEAEQYGTDETTGLSFSPNGRHLYFAIQARGILFEVTRIDGLPFGGQTLNIKYHNTDPSA